MSIPQRPPTHPVVHNRPVPTEKPKPQPQPQPPRSTNFHPNVSADPSVYSEDYGHVTQMDTRNLGTLVDKVFDDIYQDKPSDFYRDYRQLLNDIQVRFSMVSSVEPPPVTHHRPQPQPPPPPIYRQQPPPPSSKQGFVDYSRIPKPPSSQTRLCDTLIYIPNPR